MAIDTIWYYSPSVIWGPRLFDLPLEELASFVVDGLLVGTLAFVLVATNWFIAPVGLILLILMGSVTRIEEQTLIEKFGDAYREYMKHTGRFLPS